MSKDLFLTTTIMEGLIEILPTGYAYLLLYLVAKTRERGQDFITISYAILGELVGLTKASVGRGLNKLQMEGFIKISFDERHRTVIHTYNISEIINRVKQSKQERDTSETIPKQERDDSEPLGSPSPVPLSIPDISSVSTTSTPTPETPPIVPPKRFVKPKAGEVTAYALSIDFKLDGQEFCDFYESKGWVVGKSPMKNWKAAVRTWKKAAPIEKLILPPIARKLKEPEPELPSEEELVSPEDIHALVIKLAGGAKGMS